MRPCVALLTDFGSAGFYPAALHGVLLQGAPDARVVDITHDIPAQDVAAGSFVLDLVFDYFPRGTIFICVVDPGVGGERDAIVVDAFGGWVIGPDNGVTTDLLRRGPVTATYAIDADTLGPYRAAPARGSTFAGRDVFAPAACAIAGGRDARLLGAATTNLERCPLPSVAVTPGRVTGVGRYQDPFGSVLSAIRPTHLRGAFGPASDSSLRVTVCGRDLGAPRSHYTAAQPGELVAVLNSWGVLEVAAVNGSAIEVLGVPGPASAVFEIFAAG